MSACLIGVALLLAGRFLYASVEHMLALNRYVEWSSSGQLPLALADAERRLELPAETQQRLAKLIRDLLAASEQQEPIEQSPLIVPEAEGSTSPDVCRVEYDATPRDLCRSLLSLPKGQSWNQLRASLQRVLAVFASAMPTAREVGCKGSRCYPRALASWFGLTVPNTRGFPLVAPLIYLADDRGDVDKSATVISYPKRVMSSGYKVGDRPWYRIPVEGDAGTWLTIGDGSPVARCALTAPYQDVGSVFGIVRTLVCWPYADSSGRVSGPDAVVRKRPRFVLAIDLWWEDSLASWPGAAIRAALQLDRSLPVSLAIIAGLLGVTALVSLRRSSREVTYLVRRAAVDGSQRDKSVVREVASEDEAQAGIKLPGSWTDSLFAQALLRKRRAQRESIVLRVDYEAEPEVRGVELWEVFCTRHWGFELLGVALALHSSVRVPRATVVLTHTGRSLPRIEYVERDAACEGADFEPAELRARIEAQILQGRQGELTEPSGHAAREPSDWPSSARSFPELEHYRDQAQRLRAGRFRFTDGAQVVRRLYQQADVEAVHRLQDLLQMVDTEQEELLLVGNLVSRIAVCDSEAAWHEAQEQERDKLARLFRLIGANRLRVGFVDRLSQRLQRLNERDFALIDQSMLVVFDRRVTFSYAGREQVRYHGYVSTKRADVAFYRHIFDTLWSSAERVGIW